MELTLCEGSEKGGHLAVNVVRFVGGICSRSVVVSLLRLRIQKGGRKFVV